MKFAPRSYSSGTSWVRVRSLILGLAVAPLAVAQPILEEVIVTATKRASAVADYDGLIGVVSEDELARQQVAAIDDLGRTVAGLVFRQRGNRAYDNITLRGQSSIDFYEPKVQVYIDGFVQDQATYGTLLPGSVKQVEVLYGPQGSLYGRGAIGGVLDVVTISPAEAPAVQLSTRQGNLVEEYALAASTASYRGWSADIAGTVRDTDGEYSDMLTGARLGDREDKHYRGRLYFDDADSPWSMALQVSGADVDSSEEQYVPAALLDERIAFPVENHYELESDHYGLTLGYDFGDLVLTSLTSYQDRELERVVFGAYSPEYQTTTTQELRLTSGPQADHGWSYAAGVYYEETEFEFLRPAYGMASRQDSESLALFGEVSWQLSDALSATLGLRAEQREVEASGAFGAYAVTGDDDFSAVSPKLALGYKLSEVTRLYALYSTGYKPGGFTRLVTPAIASFSYDPETVDNYEVGLRQALWQNRAQLTLAAYWTRNDDYQLYVDTQPNQYLQNVGEAKSEGVDASFQWSVTEAFTASVGYAWNRAEFTEYDNPLTPGLDLSGNRLPHAPEHSANVSLSYRIQLPGQWGTVTPSIHANYVDEMYFDETNSIGEDAVTLYNATLDWQLAKHYRIELYGTNLTDETYTVYGFAYPGVGDLYQLGQGREAGVRLSAEF